VFENMFPKKVNHHLEYQF